MRGLSSIRRLLKLACQSRFGAGGVNASQIAYGRTIQNSNGMTHLAVARHGFSREENARGERWFRCGAGCVDQLVKPLTISRRRVKGACCDRLLLADSLTLGGAEWLMIYTPS